MKTNTLIVMSAGVEIQTFVSHGNITVTAAIVSVKRFVTQRHIVPARNINFHTLVPQGGVSVCTIILLSGFISEKYASGGRRRTVNIGFPVAKVIDFFHPAGCIPHILPCTSVIIIKSGHLVGLINHQTYGGGINTIALGLGHTGNKNPLVGAFNV